MRAEKSAFGIVLLEALACGLPAAILPAAGPRDAIESTGTGVLDHAWEASGHPFLRRRGARAVGSPEALTALT